MDPSALDYTKATKLVQPPEGFAEAEAMAYREEPDQLGCGNPNSLDGFLGPTGLDLRGLPSEATARFGALNQDVRNDLRRKFTEVDRLSEVLDRRTDGPLGHRPRLEFEVTRTLEEGQDPTPEEQALLDELAAIQRWAERPRTDLHRALRKLDRAKSCFGRGFLRPFVPAAKLTAEAEGEGREARTVYRASASDLEAALRLVRGEVLTPDRAALHAPADTGDEVGVVLFGEGTDAAGKAVPKAAEVSYADDGATPLEGHAPTVVRHVEGGDAAAREQVYDLRGRPMLVELRDDAGAFIDGPARRLQKAINTASTERRIVLDEDGFRVRVLLGARPPGSWQPTYDEAGRVTSWDFEPAEDAFAFRPGDVFNVGGEEIYGDPDPTRPNAPPRVTGVSQPRIGTFEAADPQGYTDEVRDRTLELRERCKQAWVHTTGEAGVSGVSREVAMADYLTDAVSQAASIGAAAAAYVEMVADLAACLMGQPGRYYGVRARVECKVSKPPVRPDEMRAIAEMVRERLASRKWAMQQVGIDDVEAVLAEIEGEEQAEAERLSAQGASLFGVPPTRQPGEPSGDGAVTPADLEPQPTSA